jgi:hypothetical protein
MKSVRILSLAFLYLFIYTFLAQFFESIKFLTMELLPPGPLDPGSRGQKRHRILDPQHWLMLVPDPDPYK